MYQKTLFLFTNDLRIDDNTALNEAFLKSKTVIPLFIFNPEQVGNKNAYKSMNAIQFMIESLHELETLIKKEDGTLNFLHDTLTHALKVIIKKYAIQAIFFNKDYTPFAQKRELEIKDVCTKNGIDCYVYQDRLLINPEEAIAKKGSFYKIFTPFFKYASQLPVKKPHTVREKKWFLGKIEESEKLSTLSKKILEGYENQNIFMHGGTKQALKILDSIKKLSLYEKTRNNPSLPTTGLGAHLNFGTISVRTAYYSIAKNLGKEHELIKQLYWKEFFVHSAYWYPAMFGHAMKSQYDHIKWSNNQKLFDRWCNGTTGFPIVDAGMRQLNTTGWMHNRVRMIVASFLVKDLHIDWRWGERYFATQLIDYNPAVNNGNWQWSASTGFDAQPYFRIFNPWQQQKRFDPQCEYIKTWVKALKEYTPKEIHAWDKRREYHNYHKPIVDHKKEAAFAKDSFKKATLTT